MLNHSRLVALVLTVLLAVTGAATAGSSPDAVQWLEKMASAMQGPYKANYSATMNVNQMGKNVSMEMSGSMLQGAPRHSKMNARMEMQMPGMGAMQMSMSGISDGENMWMEIDSPTLGGKQVMKINLERMEQLAAAGGSPFGGNPAGMDPASQIREMTKLFDFDDVSVGDGKVTLRAKLTEQALAKAGQSLPGADPDGLGHFVLQLDEASGFPVEMRMGPDAEPLMVMGFADFERLDSVDDALFKYDPPEGVQVMDLGAMAGGAMAGDGN